jgi:hypothetical protein
MSDRDGTPSDGQRFLMVTEQAGSIRAFSGVPL